MLPLSVVIITFNEESNLAGCVETVKEIADEILVLDSFSTDRTQEIARSLGFTFHQHAFDGHIQQKNRAKNMAKNEWVLSLDADERLSPALIQSIKTALEGPAFDGYSMNRLNYFGSKPIKTCGWYPDKKLRLWKKNAGEWGGKNPHDRFELFDGKPSGHLNGDLLHFTYPNREAMEKQVQKFADIAARQNVHHPIFYLVFKMVFSSAFKFLRTYFLQLGFTDGAAGLFICRMQAKEVWLKYRRALRLRVTNNEFRLNNKQS